MAQPTLAVRDQRELARQLARESKAVRRETFTMAYRSKSGHLGSAFSIVDILTVLYGHFLRIDPKNPKNPDRDRFILSKGHGCSSLYVTLARRGFFDPALLETFIQDGSHLPGHPSSMLLPGIEASTGSLGHGLGIGIGMALAGKRDSKTYRTVAILSDGECDEGSTWEGILTAHHWQLGNLIAIVDYNKIQSFGRVSEVMELEPFAAKWQSFGWDTQEVDGHDHSALLAALERAAEDRGQPHVIIAHTTKGKGVSFMEDTVDWHYWTPNEQHYTQAMRELSAD